MEYFLRFLLCLLKCTLIVVVVVSLSVGAFTFAMNYANITILVTDGMKTRTGVVLGYTDRDELPKFFAESYLAGDALLGDETYKDFTINSYDAQVEILSLHTLPWEDTATVRLTETATIDGELPISKQTPEQLADPNKIRPPQWEGGEYELQLVKTQEQWIIADMKEIPQKQEAQGLAD